MKSGTLYGLSVGPGDPELLTIKALKILNMVEVLAYPAPESGKSLAREIVCKYIKKPYTEIAIRMPLDASKFPAEKVYSDAAKEISNHLNLGSNVAVLCEGDSFFYGSFLYLYELLAIKHKITVIPGVSSPMASAAALGKPLAAKNDCLIVLPATLSEDQLLSRMEKADSIVLIKVGRHINKVISALKKADLYKNAHYIERVGMAKEKIIPLSKAPSLAPYFSIILTHRRGTAWQ
tara:strand:+ start:408 stop:1112 length:705 start_codon:yes stop_codon:yes gene_type:complete